MIGYSKRVVTAVGFAVCMVAAVGFAGDVNLPFTFSPNTPAVASQVNANFSALKTAVGDHESRLAVLQTDLADAGTHLLAVESALASVGSSAVLNQTATAQAAGFNIAGTAYVTGTAPRAGKGTVSTSTDSPATLTGSGTAFGTDVVLGDLITINISATKTQSLHVVAIASPTSLTVEGNWSGTTNNLGFTVQKAVAQFNQTTAAKPPALIVKESGRVGVGVLNPATDLDVANAAMFGGVLTSGGAMELGMPPGLRDAVNPLTGGTPYIDFHYGNGKSEDYNVRLINDADGRLSIAGNFQVTGKVGIGIATPEAALHVPSGALFNSIAIGRPYPGYNDLISEFGQNVAYEQIGMNPNNNLRIAFGNNQRYVLQSDGQAVATLGWASSSDARLKTNIAPLQGALAKALALRGVTFNWKKTGAPSFGFIAQEVEQVLPDVVSTDADGFKSVDYARVTPVLVEALKAQDGELDTLRGELASMRTENRALAERLSKLENMLERLQNDSRSPRRP